MKNITKLACWPKLQKLGFIKIRYKSCGQLRGIGAALQQNGVDLLEIEPEMWRAHDWIIRCRFTSPCQIVPSIRWVKTADLLDEIMSIIDVSTVEYVMLFKHNGMLFMNPLVRKRYDHNLCFLTLWDEMKQELEYQVDLYYQNGEKRSGVWECQFHRVTSSGQAFEFNELYKQRIKIDYTELEKAEILKELAAYGFSGLEQESITALRSRREQFFNHLSIKNDEAQY